MSDQSVPPKIKQYNFSLIVEAIKLQTSLADTLRVGFKIGPKEIVMSNSIALVQGKSTSVPDELLELSSEVLFNELTRQFQPLKAIVKVYLLTEKGDRLGGVVYLSLDDFLNSYCSLGRTTEVPIVNSPDPNSKLSFRLQLIDLDDHNRFQKSDLGDESMSSAKEENVSDLDISSRLNDDLQNITEVFDIKTYLSSLQEIDTLKAEKEQMLKDARHLQQIVKALTQEERTLKSSLLDAREELKQLRNENELRQRRIEQLLADKQGLQSNQAYREMQETLARSKWEQEQAVRKLLDENQFLKSTLDDSKNIEADLKDRILELGKELSDFDKSKLDALKAKNRELEAVNRQLREEAANQKSKLSADYIQKQNEYLQRIKSLEQKLTGGSNSSVGRSRADSSGCPKCKSMEEDFNTKFHNYEEELQVLENILYESKNETKKFQKKLEDRTRKCRFYEQIAGQLRQFKESMQFAIDKLLSFNKSLGDERPPLKKTDDYTEPYGFRVVFEDLLKEIRENIYFKPETKRKMSFEMDDQLAKERNDLLEEVRNKQKELTKSSANMLTAHNRIEQLQQELELARGALETLRSEYTKLADMEVKPFGQRLTFGFPGDMAQHRFNEISFSKLPQTDQQPDPVQLRRHINKLVEEKKALEDELKLFRSGGIIEKKPSRTNEVDKEAINKLDDNFTLESEPDRIPGDFKQLYAGLLRDYQQLSRDYEQIKKEVDLYREQNTRLKQEQEQMKKLPAFKKGPLPSGLHVIEQESIADDEVRDEIKSLIDSLDEPGDPVTHKHEMQIAAGREDIRSILSEIKEELLRRVGALELEVVLAHSTMFSYCSGRQQTHQTLDIFAKFRRVLDDMRSYVELIGR